MVSADTPVIDIQLFRLTGAQCSAENDGMWRTLLLCLVTLSVFADPSRCGSLPTRLNLNDPVYADAMTVERTLSKNGYTVQCVHPSTMARFFEGQKGAALFRTTSGDFEVLFLPKPYTFDALDILEERKGNRYIYSFRGKPHSNDPIDSSRIASIL
jgi:hypothetical protein